MCSAPFSTPWSASSAQQPLLSVSCKCTGAETPWPPSSIPPSWRLPPMDSVPPLRSRSKLPVPSSSMGAGTPFSPWPSSTCQDPTRALLLQPWRRALLWFELELVSHRRPWPTPCSGDESRAPCATSPAGFRPPALRPAEASGALLPQEQRAAAPISLQRPVRLSTQPAPLLPYGRAAPTLPDLFSCTRYCLGAQRRLPKCSHARASFFFLLWPSPSCAWWLASLLLARSLVVQRHVATARRARHLFDAMPSQVIVRRQPPWALPRQPIATTAPSWRVPHLATPRCPSCSFDFASVSRDWQRVRLHATCAATTTEVWYGEPMCYFVVRSDIYVATIVLLYVVGIGRECITCLLKHFVVK
jgi:hypothetical protein